MTLGFGQRALMGMAARSPRAQARVKLPEHPRLGGTPIYCSVSIPEGEFFHSLDPGVTTGRVVFVGPLTYWRLRHPGVEPMLSRHCRGVSELDRDRRRYPRPVD